MFDRASSIYPAAADKLLTALNMWTPSRITTAPAVRFTHPPSHLFQFPPAAEPSTLSPPVSDGTLARPFTIDPTIYNNALHFAVPVSIALAYAAVVSLFNHVNKQRQYKPWALSKSVLFYAFVLMHNIFLALYSAWTCLGMVNAFRQSWPGLSGPHGVAGAVDALCKIHGPRGLGSAATYDPHSSRWGVTDRLVRLLKGSPDPTDVGRIWNEGLAFYGWLFYISKFYEIMDTFIILAKGKKSSLLQTYHHAGAMMCMWAGIRYMSPPIWMFVFINSGLHAAMYTYYALGTLSLPVPRILKQTLTTLQIAQFIFGALYALAHLFISYDIPVLTPYLFVRNISSAMPAVASSVSSVVSSATASAGLGSWLKKAALRAAGEEGLAENVRNNHGETFGIDAIHAARVEEAQKEIRYKTQYQPVHCLDTPGQVFAILLNALYLAPLTWLFINFFVQSYIKRVRSATPPPDRTQIAKESSKDAAHNLEKEIEDAMAEQVEGNQAELPPAVQENLERAKANFKNKADDLSSKTRKTAQDVNDVISRTAHTAKTEAEKKAKNAKEAVTNQMENAKESYEKLAKEGKEAFEKRKQEAKEALEKRTREAKEAYEKRMKEAGEVLERAKEGKEALEKRANVDKEALQKELERLEQICKKRYERILKEPTAKDAKEALEQRARDSKEAVANTTDSGIAGASEVAQDSVEQAEKAVDNLTQDGRDESDEGDQDSMAVQVEDSDDHNDSQDIVKIDNPGSEQGTGPEPELEDAQPGKGEDYAAAQADTKVEGEVEKADEEWDPEDGRDPEAEAYEVQIDQMLNASEKRAEEELLPDLS